MNDLSSAATVCGVESSNFQVTVVPTETVSVMGVNMKLLISTVDPPVTAAEPPEVGTAAVAAVVDADELAAPPLELEPHPAAARTAICATKRKSRRDRTEDPPDASARFMSCPVHQGTGRGVIA